MGIVGFSPPFSRTAALSGLASPFHAFLALFMPSAAPAPQAIRSPGARSVPLSIAARLIHQGPDAGNCCDSALALPIRAESRQVQPSRLKVVRRFEPGVAASLAGRMVISGRMADVCAELDRMERKESGTAQIPML